MICLNGYPSPNGLVDSDYWHELHLCAYCFGTREVRDFCLQDYLEILRAGVSDGFCLDYQDESHVCANPNCPGCE